jgi:iron complex outermembrane recepter protein
VSQRYQSKIVDQNLAAAIGPGTSGRREVAGYEQYNLNLRYTGIKKLALTLGVNNVLNQKPPLTNHTGYRGYLTSVADVLGRSYVLGAEYKF